MSRCTESTLTSQPKSDASIWSIEDNEIRRVSREVGLDHRDFIAARSNYKEHLEVLKTRPPGRFRTTDGVVSSRVGGNKPSLPWELGP